MYIKAADAFTEREERQAKIAEIFRLRREKRNF